jgi:NAD dependent epimerase/dehydratase family enzyme
MLITLLVETPSAMVSASSDANLRRVRVNAATTTVPMRSALESWVSTSTGGSPPGAAANQTSLRCTVDPIGPILCGTAVGDDAERRLPQVSGARPIGRRARFGGDPGTTTARGTRRRVRVLGARLAEPPPGCDALVHLPGKRVGCRPTQRNIDELIASRERTVRLIGDAVGGLDRPPQRGSSSPRWRSKATAAIRSSTKPRPPPTTGPRQQVEVRRRWEAAFEEAAANISRQVLLRPAIGIGRSGDPAAAQSARLARFGLCGSIAGGRRWVSWIAIGGMLEVLQPAVVDASMTGLNRLTAPTPTTHAGLMPAYRHAVGRRFGPPAPALVVERIRHLP